MLAGLYLALQVFGVAQAVLSVVGLAGVVALALGFGLFTAIKLGAAALMAPLPLYPEIGEVSR